MLFNFASALVFLIFGGLFVLLNLGIARILQARNPHPVKLSTYECGELPEGESWVQFNIRFYVVALVFLIFEVEIVFLFPWAIVFKDLGLFAFVEMMIFVLNSFSVFNPCVSVAKNEGPTKSYKTQRQ